MLVNLAWASTHLVSSSTLKNGESQMVVLAGCSIAQHGTKPTHSPAIFRAFYGRTVAVRYVYNGLFAAHSLQTHCLLERLCPVAFAGAARLFDASGMICHQRALCDHPAMMKALYVRT